MRSFRRARSADRNGRPVRNCQRVDDDGTIRMQIIGLTSRARSRHIQAWETCASGMVTGMATRKVTVTLDEVQLDQIRALVQARTAPSVSGFVQHAVAVALDDVAGWGAMLAEALRQTGGPLSVDERAWADDVLGTSTRPAA